MTSEQNLDIIRDLTLDSAKSVFEAYGVSLSISEANPGPQMTNLGVIGFTGEQLKGTLVLSGEDGPFREAGKDTGTELSALQDWVGEMSNQLLGRIKNKIIEFGAELQMSTPLAVCGMGLNIAPTNDDVLSFSFASDFGRIQVCVDLSVKPDVVLERGEEECPEEGDFLLF